MCAQARRRFTQVIHMVVHSKAGNTFSCRAGRQQRVSVPVLARGGRHAGRGSGLGLDDIAPDGGHLMLAAHPAGQAARVPRRLPAVTLIVIPPAARPRHAQAARAQSPPALAPGLRQHGHEPGREEPVPIDDQVQQLITGRQRPMPGRWPRRRPCSRRRGTQSCGLALRRSCTGLLPARQLPRSPPPARRGRPGTSPVPGRTPDHRGRHFRGCRGAGPGKTFLPGRIRHGPSMYEMEGPCPASPRRLASCLALPAPRAARRGQVPARGTGLPAPPAFPGSPPGGARFQR